MLRWIIPAVLLMAPALASGADLLQIGDELVTKNDSLRVVLNVPEEAEGKQQVRLTWTDSYGRKVAEDTVEVDGSQALSVPLDKAVALQNFLQAELTVGERTLTSKKEFIVTPESPAWDDYAVVMYNAYKTPVQQKALWDIGINAGKVSSASTQRPDGGQVWYQYGFPFYCDQIATAFYASYHTPAYSPKHLKLIEAEKAYVEADRQSKKPFYREPCFHDREELAIATSRLAQAARAQKRLRPLFYAHTDEGGVANLVEAWDFCFKPETLEAMRDWLKVEYGTLDALNAQWETDFAGWDEVAPLSTDEMMARGGTNFSPWADHRHFMNKVFADVLKAGTDAVEQVDPGARVGLVGCQMPSAFGGYDYWLLSQVMTAIEPYNIGNNREIWRSFAPDKPSCTTGFGAGQMDIWRLWYQALHGDLGVILYDEQYRYLDEQGEPTEMALGIAPTYKELTGGIAKQIAQMDAVNDPVAIHYSHPSITAWWMLEVAPSHGKNWINRGSAIERKDSDFLRLRESFVKMMEDNQRTYTFVAYGQLENGEFDRMDKKVLFLPQSIAMSTEECDAVRRFVTRGGIVVADARTALMDEHCKMLDAGRLDNLFAIQRSDLEYKRGTSDLRRTEAKSPFKNLPDRLEGVVAAEPGVRPAGKAVALYTDEAGTPAVIVNKVGKGMAIYLNADVTDYHRWRLSPPMDDTLRQFVDALLAGAGIDKQYTLTMADGKPASTVEIFPYTCGDLTLLGLNRNYQLRVSELGPPEFQSQAALEHPMKVKVDLGDKVAVYNQRTGKFLGERKSVEVEMPQHEPVILALLPAPIKALKVDAPASARRGDLVEVSLKLDGKKVGRMHAIRCELIAPSGESVRPVAQNLLAPKGQAVWQVAFALNDPAGDYTLRVRDVATGVAAEQKITVQ